MEHPLISNLDDLSLEELSEKVSELNKKLGIAVRTGNYHLSEQIRMALESYQNKYQEKLRDNIANSPNFSDKINIQ